MVVDLKYTGERLVPDMFPFSQRIVMEHVERYRYAAQTIHDHIPIRRPLIMDMPCGAGYGSVLLAEQTGGLVHGYDIDPETVDYARARYGSGFEDGSVHFMTADMQNFVPHVIFDAVVCFEGIEHVEDMESTARNLCDTLKPTGLLFVSTPRRDGPGGGSEFHTRELTRDELATLFAPYLRDIKVIGQELRAGDCLPDDHARFYILVGRK